jgi:hypothetical protein
MEKAKGALLGELWYQLPRPAKNDIIEQIVNLETLLASRPFPAHGCLFYTDNVPKPSDYEFKIPGDTLQTFSLGPVVDPVLWEDGRANLDTYKGPCQSFLIQFDFVTSLLSPNLSRVEPYQSCQRSRGE